VQHRVKTTIGNFVFSNFLKTPEHLGQEHHSVGVGKRDVIGLSVIHLEAQLKHLARVPD